MIASEASASRRRSSHPRKTASGRPSHVEPSSRRAWRAARRIAALLTAWIAVAAAADPAAPHFVPAHFGHGPDALLRLVSCPESPPEESVVVVFCQAWVDGTGGTRSAGTGCIPESRAATRFSRAGTEALARAQFLPASVDGWPVDVFMPFRLRFERSAAGCRVSTIANLGGELGGSDLDYLAPQEILNYGHWAWRVPALRLRGPRSLLAGIRGLVFTISVAVAADGTASDGQVERALRSVRTVARTSARELERSRFIPGFRDGQPVPMRYRSLLWTSLE